jgi:hypothetical protein
VLFLLAVTKTTTAAQKTLLAVTENITETPEKLSSCLCTQLNVHVTLAAGIAKLQ